MDFVYGETYTVAPDQVTEQGILKLSALLELTQKVSAGHCKQLGTDWDTMSRQGKFWAVLRHRAQIFRLPRVGERVRVETWPMPTTRVAYPRCVRFLDSEQNVICSVVSLWVVMDTQTRGMLLPAKSGVTVEGTLRGVETDAPASLHPCQEEHTALWTVTQQDLDENRHVNNAKYVDHAAALMGNDRLPKEMTVCYLSEVILGQTVSFSYTLSETGIFAADGYRTRTDVPDKKERVFAISVTF